MPVKIDNSMELGESVSDTANNGHERREGRRYPVTIPLEYRVYGASENGTGEVRHTGSGRTVNMSSAGVIFDSDRPLREGMEADLSIAWPASLSKSVGLTLRIRGRIVRASENRAALTMTHYEFRTRALPVASEHGLLEKDRAAG
jgi:hypothetical protein